MDDIYTHEYSYEEDDKEVLIYNSRGKLVSIKYKNKLKESI